MTVCLSKKRLPISPTVFCCGSKYHKEKACKEESKGKINDNYTP